jgi:Glycerophosphoryl diester phosphodiesterase
MNKKLSDVLKQQKIIAHRGSWDRINPENSKPALARAIENGLGIETDVHLIKDGSIAVFHDYSLKRMCGASSVIENQTEETLQNFRLKKTDCRIPTLQWLLAANDDKVPLFIELKCSNGNDIALADALITATHGYENFVFIGFSEIAIKYLTEKGYSTCLSRFKPKPADFSPDGMLAITYLIPSSAKKRAVFPPFIAWTAGSRLAKRIAEKRAAAVIYNTKHFKHFENK